MQMHRSYLLQTALALGLDQHSLEDCRACCRHPWPSMAAYRPYEAFSLPNFTVRGSASEASAACGCFLGKCHGD